MKNNNSGEFRGSTKQALTDLREEIQELKKRVESLNTRFWIILILLILTTIERLPTLINFALASIK